MHVVAIKDIRWIMRFLKSEFLRKWIKANLIGLLIGVFVGPILFFLVIMPSDPSHFAHYSAFHASLYDILAEIFIWFPIGAGLGIAQQRLLREWNIRPYTWIIATSLGFVLPTTLIAWVLPQIDWLLIHKEWGSSITNTLSTVKPFIVGLMVSLLQAWLLRKSITKPSLWVWSYLASVLAMDLIFSLLVIVPIIIAESAENFFYTYGLSDLLYYGFISMVLVIGLTLSFFASVIIGLPTGFILVRYSKRQSSITESAPAEG